MVLRFDIEYLDFFGDYVGPFAHYAFPNDLSPCRRFRLLGLDSSVSYLLFLQQADYLTC